MNFLQRKRHLVLWVIIVVTLIVLLVIARSNIPEFAGDQTAIIL